MRSPLILQKEEREFWFGTGETPKPAWYKQVYPAPARPLVPPALEGSAFEILAVSDSEVYLRADQYELDHDLKVRQEHVLPESGHVDVIGQDQLVINGAFYDLKQGTFDWDANGAKRRALPGTPGFDVVHDPNGNLWSLTYDGLHAWTAEGVQIPDIASLPHQIWPMNGTAVLPQKDRLVVAVVGTYKGQ